MRMRALVMTVFVFLYWALRRLLELLVLRMRCERAKENRDSRSPPRAAGARRQVARARLRPADRALLAAFAAMLPREPPAIAPRAAGDGVALAPRARPPPLDVRSPRAGTAVADCAGTGARAAPSGGEPGLGLQAHPWRACRARDRLVVEQRLEHPAPVM